MSTENKTIVAAPFTEVTATAVPAIGNDNLSFVERMQELARTGELNTEPKEPESPPQETAASQSKKTEPKKEQSESKSWDEEILEEESDEKEKPADANIEEDFLAEAPEDVKADPKQANAWSGIKKELKELKKERDALRSEVEKKSKLQDADPIKQELEKYRKRAEELEKVAAAYDITKTEAYQREVTSQFEEIGNGLEQIAADSEVPLESLISAFRITDPKERKTALSSLAEGMSEFDKLKLVSLNDRCMSVFRRQDELESNADAALKELRDMESKQKEQASLESKAAEMRAVANAAERLKKIAGEFVSSDDETPDSVASLIASRAQEISFDDLDPEKKGLAALSAVLMPQARKAIRHLSTKVKSLEAELKSYSGATPSPGKAQQTAERSESEFDGLSFLEAIKRRATM